MTDAPRTWYDVIAATAEALPWREEGGVKVLGATFTTHIPKAEPIPPALPPLPTREALAIAAPEALPPTPEQMYGTAVHAVLQGLPLPRGTPRAEDVLAEAQAVRAALPWLWGKGSRAEVAVVLANGMIGRADRLVPYQGAWWVIDFKTGTPQHPVPAAYVAQLQGYMAALRASDPDIPVHAAVVWTASATLAELGTNG